MLRKLVEDLRAIDDPAEQGRMATETLEHFKALNEEVAQIRQSAAKALRGQGRTYREIGVLFGPEGRPLHYSRIQQVLKGGATGRWARVAREGNAVKDDETAAGDSATA